ncbi:MAG: hypothetical protein V5B38_11830 [Candidatus Accumulibacter propinquus]
MSHPEIRIATRNNTAYLVGTAAIGKSPATASSEASAADKSEPENILMRRRP